MHGNFNSTNAGAQAGTSQLAPNLADISAHLHALFAPDFVHRHPDAWIEIAFARPDEKLNKAEIFSAFDLEGAAKFAFDTNKRGFNVYVGAALRHGEKPKSGRANDTHFLATRYSWAEYDNAGDHERITELCKAEELQPALGVVTGTIPHQRLHIYFLTAYPVTEADEIKSCNKALKELFSSDDVDNPSRVMRLAGTVSYPKADKRAKGYQTELTALKVNRNAPAYSVEALCGLRSARDNAKGSESPRDGFEEYASAQRSHHDSIARLRELLAQAGVYLKRGAADADKRWHIPMRDAVAIMIGLGWSNDQIKIACGPYCRGSFEDPDLQKLIDSGRNKWNKPDPGDTSQPDGSQRQAAILATPYTWTEPENIPAREFLYGRRLIRKYATATIAPGGVGKTALEVAEVLSMVSGRPLLGVQTPQLRVWLWSLEDPREEMTRRIQATAKHFGVMEAEIGDRLYLDSGREHPLVIAEAMRNGFVICRPVVDAIIAQLKERAIDVLIIDPFVSCHRVTENDNNAIDAVTKAWARVADAANCAVELVHHVRKGEQEITVESARGGGSFGDACRMVRVINRMTEQQGKDAGVDNHRLYFRTYLDKNNLAPPADKSDWYKLVSVALGNGPLGPNVAGGDSIGVVTRWEWPDATKGLSARDFEVAAAAIQAGKWRADVQAKQWVGRAVAKALRFDLDDRADKAAVKQLVQYWIRTGALVVVDDLTDKREIKQFVRVAESTEDTVEVADEGGNF
jgi:hypothetical protein